MSRSLNLGLHRTSSKSAKFEKHYLPGKSHRRAKQGMCVTFFVLGHPKYKLIVLGNRDEYLDRPADRAHFWTEIGAPDVLAGVDLGHVKAADPMGTSAKGTITQIGVEQNVVLKSGVQYDRETVTSETPAAAAAVSGVTNEQRKNPTAKDDVDAVSPVSTTTTAAGLAALKTHGSWMGINKRTGHFVFLTNFREHPSLTNPSALTRGYLVRDFLMSDALDAVAYARAVHSDYGKYNGFNLIVGTIDPHQAVPLGYYCGNRSSARDQPSEPLQQGIVYGMSNGVLVNGQSTWPKVERGKLLLQQALDEECADPDALIDNLLRILADKTTYDDSELPPNMYNYQVEKALCPICIDRSRTPNGQYGTLTHTIILVDHQNQARFVEVNRYAVVGPTAADTTSLLAVDEHQNRLDFRFVLGDSR